MLAYWDRVWTQGDVEHACAFDSETLDALFLQPERLRRGVVTLVNSAD